MRDFMKPGNLCNMRPLAATVLALALTGCNSPTYLAILADQDALGDSSSGDAPASSGDEVSDDTSGGEAAGGMTDTGHSSSDTADTGDSSETGAVSATGDASTTGEDAGDKAEPPEVEPPRIVSVELPAKVHAAGPVPLAVQTMLTSRVQIELDGVDLGELADAGDGLFTGELAVRGAIDNGPHKVTIRAQRGSHEVSEGASYEVSTPKPGTMAWFKAGPAGSRTNRVALTPDGDVLEAGHVEINKITRPALRRRSGLTGAELWSVSLDTREGEVADLAVLPDGRVWVAMNVRKPGAPSPQPRIALFDAAGKFAGAEALGDLGHVVRGVAADPAGGCFAVGFASAGKDLDIAFWRVNAAGVQTLGGTWDYVPNKDPHSFSEFATDVVLKGDGAWVVGASNGNHEKGKAQTRGILVPMSLDTGEVMGPVIVAAASGSFTQNVFFGAGGHPDGVLVTGYGFDDTNTEYRIETALYGPQSPKHLWHAWEAPSGLALQYGSDVVLDSQGRALVAGAITENGALRGYVFARPVYGEPGVSSLFEHWFPASTPAGALSLLVDTYDRIFVGGYITANGSTQARLVLVHG